MAVSSKYDFTGVKAITTPWGALTKITNAAGAVIWEKQVLHEYQKLTGYVWKKYNLNSTITEGSSYTIDNLGEIGYIYKDITIISGSIYGQTSYQDGKTGRHEYVNGLWREYPYFDGNPSYYGNAPDGWYKATSSTSANAITLSQSKGSYIGEVTATSRSQYPDNGASGNYWYVYDRAEYTTVTSEYKLNEGAQTTLSGMSSQRPSGYPSVWVDTNGNITGNGTAYTNTWRSYYSTYKSSYPYIYYNSKWYRIVSATSTSATVVPLTTSK